MFSIGDVFSDRAFGVLFTYRLREIRPYTNRQENTTKLLIWDAICPACGVQFEAASGANPRGHIVRGCPAHRPWTKHATTPPGSPPDVNYRAKWARGRHMHMARLRGKKVKNSRNPRGSACGKDPGGDPGGSRGQSGV